MKKVNYHTHCARCRHATGTEENYVEKALDYDLNVLGFSDHLPFPGDIFGMRMPYSELEEYLDTVQNIKEKYKNKLEILCGFEGEYIKDKEYFYERLLNEKKCDYLIMGQHFYEDSSGNMINVYNIRNSEQYIDYANYSIQGMKSGYFSIFAHPDIIFLNNLKWDDNCRRACDLIIEAATMNNCIVEYNANGYRRGLHEFIDGKRYQYPHIQFWKRAAEARIPVIIGSDCHEPIQVYDDIVKKAYQEAGELGLNIVLDINNL
ncbi:MAG: histidinol-phosphatase [Eubacteriales bacterium]|nr:histidinol-phosphatase [Eubacteriales bacterium]